MRIDKLGIVLVTLALVAGPASAHIAVPAPQQSRPVLLKGGDLHTVSDGVLPATDLLFDDGRIVRIGKNLEAPAGAEIVDVSGKRVYPGLVACLTTLGLTEIGAVRATNDLTERGDVTPEVITYEAFNPDSELIPTVRSHGITTAQIIPIGSLVRGRSFITHLDGWTREDSAVKMLDGLHLNWPSVAVIDAWWMRQTPEEQKKRMAENRKRLREVFDHASAYSASKRAGRDIPIDLRWEAMLPLFDRSMPLYVSANDYRQIVEAVRFAAEYDLRLVIVGGRESDRAARLLRENQVPVIISSVLAHPMRADDPYDRAYRLAAALHAGGVKFAIADEGSWETRNLPFQAAQAAAFGLPKEEALRAITLSPAEILGISDREGSLGVGKDATLFVSDGDVMDFDGQAVSHMWIQGRPVDLDNKHKQLYRKYLQKPGIQ